MRAGLRRRNALAVHDLHYGPNMTPMVDVVMVILIFFMASAVFLGPEWFLRTALPVVKGSSVTAGEEQPTRIRVYVERAGSGAAARVEGGALVSIETAIGMLERATREKGSSKVVVLVTPVSEAPYDAVVAIHEACQRLGIAKVGISEESP